MEFADGMTLLQTFLLTIWMSVHAEDRALLSKGGCYARSTREREMERERERERRVDSCTRRAGCSGREEGGGKTMEKDNKTCGSPIVATRAHGGPCIRGCASFAVGDREREKSVRNKKVR
jgi:hypothetical protein